MSKREKRIRASEQIPADGSQTPPSDFHAEVRLSFKYVEPGGQFCLSECKKEQVKIFKTCLKKLSKYTIGQLLQTASKNPQKKQGLAWEVIDDAALGNVTRPTDLDPSCRIGCVRANDRMRLFLTHKNSVFYVLWFDKDHAICKV